jgi:hypothetical protein
MSNNDDNGMLFGKPIVFGDMSTYIKAQPPPAENNNPAVWDLVIADMKERSAFGVAKYGTPLQPHNGRDPLTDAYQEALDLAVYLRQALYERDNPKKVVSE